MRNEGVTLTELLVVVSIIGILVIALGFSFQGWQGKYRIESQIKDLYSDLMDARTKAMTRNRMHFIVLNANNYQEYADTNDNNTPNPGTGDTPIPEFTNPKTLKYSLGWTGTIAFDRRGLASTTATIIVNVPSSVDSDYDCIHVYQSRIRMGKFNGTICAEK